MKITQVRKMMYGSCILCLVLLGLACLFKGTPQYVLIAAGLVALAGFFYIWKTKWVCPHCGRHLGRDVVNTKYCKKCKRPLE